MHFVYMVRCADGSLYTGYARDPLAREKVHNAGRGAKYTAARRPVTLVFTQKLRTRSAALRREYQLKCCSRAQKLALLSRRTTTRHHARRAAFSPSASSRSQ